MTVTALPPILTPGDLLIEGHQRLISPFLTRNHEAGVNYGTICSIYLVHFAGSGTAVALLTHDHGPSATGTFTRSGTEPSSGAFRSGGVLLGGDPGHLVSQGLPERAECGPVWAGQRRAVGRSYPPNKRRHSVYIGIGTVVVILIIVVIVLALRRR